MSLGINTTTPEGIVLAADSRQSYRNLKNMSRVGSDSASKIFKLSSRVGLIVTGLAFIPENGTPKNISRFVDDFKKVIDAEDLTVNEISNELKIFFEEKYQYQDQLKQIAPRIKVDLERQGATIEEIKEEKNLVSFSFVDKEGRRKKGVAGVDQLQFIVSGFNKDDSHQASTVYVPGEVELKRDSTQKGKEYGASWIGQIDVVARIVLGFDGRIGNLPMIQKAVNQPNGDEIKRQLKGLEYVIQWGTMTLQDGIDFSVLMIETTTAIQRFSDGIQLDPGDMPGVGGPIDVAVITQDKGFVWVAKKNLNVRGMEVDLEKIDNLSTIYNKSLVNSKSKKR